MLGRLEKSRKNAPKALPDRVLKQLAGLADVPDEQRESFSKSVRTKVQTSCELDALTKGGMANKRGATLHQAALTLYDKLGNLNNTERALLEAILSNAHFGFDRISSEGVGGFAPCLDQCDGASLHSAKERRDGSAVPPHLFASHAQRH